ncbi:MAG: tetratricopeptide repeat protein [Promethearchaeota archaeon]
MLSSVIRKDLDHAIECYQKVVEVNPQDASSWYNLGGIYSDKKNYELEFTDLILDYLDVYTEDDNQGDFRNDFTPDWKCKIL